MDEFNLSTFLFKKPNNGEDEPNSTEYNWCGETLLQINIKGFKPVYRKINIPLISRQLRNMDEFNLSTFLFKKPNNGEEETNSSEYSVSRRPKGASYQNTYTK